MLFGERRDYGKTTWLRVLIGVVFAPAIPFVIFLPTAWALWRVWIAVFPDLRPTINGISVSAFVFLGPPYAYVTTILVGLPMFMLYQRWGWHGRIRYALGGLLACYIGTLPVYLFGHGDTTWPDILLMWAFNGAMVGVFIAVPAALIFRWIVLGPPPNRGAGQEMARK